MHRFNTIVDQPSKASETMDVIARRRQGGIHSQFGPRQKIYL